MTEETIRNVLKTFGLTNKEIDVYIFLAKNQPLKGGDLAKNLHIQKAQVYRSLKDLQKKAIVESTLESPTRFTAVSFETVVDLLIKAKQQEANLIEITKQELINDWRKIIRPKDNVQVDKFMVIDDKKIYLKILQLVKGAKNQILTVTSFPHLSHVAQLGLFEVSSKHQIENKLQCRMITNVSNVHFRVVNELMKTASKAGIDLSIRTPQLGLLLPRMVIRDQEEALFYITPMNTSTVTPNETCFWTNCKALVQVFTSVFEEAWSNSTNTAQETEENRTIQSNPDTYIISGPKIAQKVYTEAIKAAKKEITIITSPDWLLSISNSAVFPVREFSEKGVCVKIMAPITGENIKAAQQLSRYCEIKHVPMGYMETTVIDRQHLFQFRDNSFKDNLEESLSLFDDVYYSSSVENVKKAQDMVDNIWNTAQSPSPMTLESITNANRPIDAYSISKAITVRDVFKRIDSRAFKHYKNLTAKLNEKQLINKIVEAQKSPSKTDEDNLIVQYGTAGQAIVHTPASFKLPDMLFYFMHHNKQSTHGLQDGMIVCEWMQTPKGNAFVPSALVYDNPKSSSFWKKFWVGTPLQNNLILVEKDQIQVQLQGNTLFVGWTVPVPLPTLSSPLPPACILLEGYGQVKTVTDRIEYLSGYCNLHEVNGLEAFVTFLHPTSKYSGPGTDGYLARESIMTIFPPKLEEGKD